MGYRVSARANIVQRLRLHRLHWQRAAAAKPIMSGNRCPPDRRRLLPVDYLAWRFLQGEWHCNPMGHQRRWHPKVSDTHFDSLRPDCYAGGLCCSWQICSDTDPRHHYSGIGETPSATDYLRHLSGSPERARLDPKDRRPLQPSLMLRSARITLLTRSLKPRSLFHRLRKGTSCDSGVSFRYEVQNFYFDLVVRILNLLG